MYDASTRGAAFGQTYRLSVVRALFLDDRGDLRNHIPRAPNHHPVSHMQIQPSDLIHVVQGRVGYRNPADKCRLQPRHRRNRTGTSHLKVHAFHH